MRIPACLLALVIAFSPFMAFAGPVDINSANAETISAELKGVGLAKAKAIVEYREKHGPFQRPDDLSLVKGIGDRTVAINKANIRIGSDKKK